ALDNGGNVAITFTGAINFSIDAGGPESPGAGIPVNYTFTSGDAGVHVFNNGLAPIKAANPRSLTAGCVSGCGTGVTAGTQSGINVSAASTVGLQVLIQGEANDGGKLTAPAGKDTIPLNFTAGSPFNVTVNAVDQYW